MPDAPLSPRLVITDTLGRRIVPIDKSLFTIGRRSETDLRLPGADISRVHAEITLENETCTIRDKQSRFGTFVNDLLDGELAQLHTGTVALGIRHVLCTPLRLVRYVERAEQKVGDEIIGVLYLDSRERGALKSASAQAALETLSAEAALAIENARLYREALDKAKFEQELRVAAAIQQSLLPIANRDGACFLAGGGSI